MIDIAKARALCEAATAGEWYVNRIQGYCDNQIETRHPDFVARKPWGHVVANVGLCSGDVDQTKFENDFEFIATARTLLPEALDEIERLRDLPAAAVTGTEAGMNTVTLTFDRELASWRAKQLMLDKLADLLGVCEGVCPLRAAVTEIERLRAKLAATCYVAGPTHWDFDNA